MKSQSDSIAAILDGTTPNVFKVVSSNTIRESISQFEVGLHPDACKVVPNIYHKGPVLVLGKKLSKSTLIIHFSKKLEKGCVYLNKVGMNNLRIKSNDTVKMYGIEDEDVRSANVITIAGVKETLDGIEGDIFNNLIRPYFENIPSVFLSVNSIYKIKAGIKCIEVKVAEINYLDSENKEENCECAQVIDDTGIFLNAEISRNEIEKELAKVGYEDIGGCRRQMAQIRECIELPLKHPELFEKIGIKPPRGILLHGPPGTGKTMIAKAIANECGASLLAINGPEIMSKMNGESESNLRKAFETARKNAPSIIFMDEIDSIAGNREKSSSEGERRIVSQLLTLMDGMHARTNIVVLAATNRPNSLDPALRRFGRFDREIEIGVPDEVGRLDILRIHTKNMRISPSVDLVKIATDTHGCTGSDIASMCTEAGLMQLRAQLPNIDLDSKVIPASVLASLEVNEENFRIAINNTDPSSLRETVIETPNIKWSDIGGLVGVKNELIETVMYPVNHADKYLKFGQNPSKGVLLYGPPGCGKTLLAKAVATECKANFISIKGPELLSKWVGDSEGNVRNIFDKARGSAPCVLFFDEIDSIGKSRTHADDGGSGVTDRMLNQILVEMDGMNQKKDVFVMGATNRPKLLDSALMRPGRLDQIVYIPLPDHNSRLSILKAKLKNTPLGEDVDLGYLAGVTSGFSGADLTEICQRAAKLAIKDSIKIELSNPDMEYDPVPAISMKYFNGAMENARKSVSQSEIDGYESFARSMNVTIKTSENNTEPNGMEDDLYD